MAGEGLGSVDCRSLCFILATRGEKGQNDCMSWSGGLCSNLCARAEGGTIWQEGVGTARSLARSLVRSVTISYDLGEGDQVLTVE